jgi:Tfp pilus assembly protein PilN
MQRLIGVSFDNSSLHAAIVDRRLRFVKPLKSDDWQLPEIHEKRQEFIGEIFAKFKKDYSPNGIVIGLPSKHFSHHIIELPLTRKVEIKNALHYELEKYLPLTVDEYIFDFAIISKTSGKAKVLVLSIKRDILKSFIDIAFNAGLAIQYIRCSVLEAVNNFLLNNRGKNLNCLFIYAGETFYDIVGLKDSLPVFLKTISKGKNITLEIERLLLSFPDGVYISGNTDLSALEKVNIKTYPLSLSNAIAITAFKKQPFSLNFLPAEFLRKKPDYYPYLLGGTAAATVLLFLLTPAVSYYKGYRTLKFIENRINAIKKQASGLLESKKRLESIQTDRKFLYDFKSKGNLPIRVIGELSNILPKDAWIINLSVDDKGKIEMEGFTRRTSELVLSLENSEIFKNVSFSAPIIAKEGEERFSLKMEIEWL